ncbi:MAG: sulfotransferase [Pseudomonadota bacterium]
MTEFRNDGLWLRNDRPPDGRDTYVIVGVPRSGTSMIAGCLERLGVFTGERSNQVVFEDLALSRAVEAGDAAETRAIIRRYNAAHDRWLWKRPEAWKKLRDLLPLFRNPRLIVPLRDALAIAMRNHVAVQADVGQMLARHAKEYVDLIASLDSLRQPVLMVSYEKALSDPERFLEVLIGFCGLDPSPEAYGAALSFIEPEPALYRQRARLRYVGEVAPLDGKTLTGWAGIAGRVGQHVSVELRIDGKPRKTSTANRTVEWKKGMPGRKNDYGFKFSLPPFVRQGAVIDVGIPNSDIVLEGSGQTYRK